jgi:hypothetical protein
MYNHICNQCLSPLRTGKTKLANVTYEWGRSALVLVNCVSGIPLAGTLSQMIVQLSNFRLWIDFCYFWCLTPLSAIIQLYHGDQF